MGYGMVKVFKLVTANGDIDAVNAASGGFLRKNVDYWATNELDLLQIRVTVARGIY